MSKYPLESLVLPALVWAAFRFGPRETAAATCGLSAIAIWVTLRGFGPFARESQNESLLLVQAFIALAAVPSLVLAAAVQDRQQAERADVAIIRNVRLSRAAGRLPQPVHLQHSV